MPFSKFDPHRPPEPGDDDPLQAANPEARRRAMALRWGTWITLGMTVMGYALIAYWILT